MSFDSALLTFRNHHVVGYSNSDRSASVDRQSRAAMIAENIDGSSSLAEEFRNVFHAHIGNSFCLAACASAK